jgi:hypothetical protein
MNGGSKQGKFRGKRKQQATLEKKGMCRESDAMPLDGQDAWNHYWHRPEIIRPLPPTGGDVQPTPAKHMAVVPSGKA